MRWENEVSVLIGSLVVVKDIQTVIVGSNPQGAIHRSLLQLTQVSPRGINVL